MKRAPHDFRPLSIPGTVLDGAWDMGNFFAHAYKERVNIFMVLDWRGIRLLGLLNLAGEIVQVDAYLNPDPEGPNPTELVQVGTFWARHAA